jgi:hypothetical protein
MKLKLNRTKPKQNFDIGYNKAIDEVEKIVKEYGDDRDYIESYLLNKLKSMRK